MKLKKPLENRSYQFEVRAEQDETHGNIIVGRPIVYGQRTDISGWFEEVIEPGALDGADLRDVRFLVNHNIDAIPLARSRNNNANSTMRLTVDNEGMAIRVDMDTENNSDARALYSAVQRGDISGMSFMFGVSDEEWDNLDSDYPTRRIKGINKVVEVSAVTFPAYEATEIQARSKDALDNARAALESAKEKRGAPDGVEVEKLKARYLYGA